MSEEAINQINNRLDETYHWIIDELRQENRQLKEEIEKLNYIIDKQDRDITTISRGNKKIKSVLDEIREYIKEKEKDGTLWSVKATDYLLQMLDKVK